MSRATLLTLNRNYVLNTTKGHSVAFEKGKPTYVPPAIYADAIAIGAVPADGSDPAVLVDPSPSTEPVDLKERADKINKAFDTLVERNGRGDFNAAGVPTAGAVSTEAGFKVQNKEVAVAWQERCDNAATE